MLGGDANVGGPKVAADILNFAGGGIERDVLKALDKTDAGQAESIRNLMFVFADIARLSDKEIQAVMKEAGRVFKDDAPTEEGEQKSGDQPQLPDKKSRHLTPLEALQAGVPWDWKSFDEYLSRLDGKLAVNAGFLVGHSALRRVVMGPDAVGKEATQEQIDEMERQRTLPAD